MAYNSVIKEPELIVIILGVLVHGGLSFVSFPQAKSWRSHILRWWCSGNSCVTKADSAGHTLTLTEIRRAASSERNRHKSFSQNLL